MWVKAILYEGWRDERGRVFEKKNNVDKSNTLGRVEEWEGRLVRGCLNSKLTRKFVM